MNKKIIKLANYLKNNGFKEESNNLLKLAIDPNPYAAFKELSGGKYNFNSNTPYEQIRPAYRELARKLHPDLPGGSTESMARLTRADTILNDPQRRGAWHQEARKIMEERRSAPTTAQPKPEASSAKPSGNTGSTPTAGSTPSSAGGKLFGAGPDATKNIKLPGMKPTTVTMQPGKLSKFFGAGGKVGAVGSMIIPMVSSYVIGKITEPSPVGGIVYNVTLNLQQFAPQVSSFRVVGAVGNAYSPDAKELATSIMDATESDFKQNGETISVAGMQRSPDVRFVPAAMVLGLIMTETNSEMPCVVSIPNSESSASYSINIDDSKMLKAISEMSPEYATLVGKGQVVKNPDGTTNVVTPNLKQISEKEYQKTIETGQKVQRAIQTGALIYGGGAAAASAGAALTAGTGGLALPIVMYAGALYSAWNLGEEIAATEWWKSEEIDNGFAYVCSLDQTPFVKNNVALFRLVQAQGAIREHKENGKILKDQYVDNINSDYSSSDKTISKVSDGNLPVDGLFLPTSIIVEVTYKDGLRIPVTVPGPFYLDTLNKKVVGDQSGKQIIVTEVQIIERTKSKMQKINGAETYSQTAQAIGLVSASPQEVGAETTTQVENPASKKETGQTPTPASPENFADPTSYSVDTKPTSSQSSSVTKSLQEKIIAAKKLMMELANKFGTTNKITEQESNIGTWDNKADALMIEIINKTYEKILPPDVAQKVKPQMAGMSGWKWKTVGPMMGYGSRLAGVMDYFADAKALS